jgi:adenylate cyclase
MKVPERIKQSFEIQQHQSEFWVAGVQLATIITLLVIYYLAPSGFSDDAPVHSAGLGLYLFVILILCRLWFTYTKQLSYPVSWWRCSYYCL